MSAGIVLALFVCAGTIKSSAAMQWIPVDLTLALGCVVAALIVGRVLTSTFFPLGGLAWGFSLAVLGLLVPAIPSEYAHAKLTAILILTLGIAFAGGVLIVTSERMLIALLLGTVLAGLVVGLLLVISPSSAPLDGRLALSGASTIAPARATGAALAVLIPLMFAGRLTLRAGVPLSAVLAVLTIGTGSRGPLGALLASAVVSALLLPSRRLRSLVLLATGFTASVQFILASGSGVRDRFIQLFSDNQGPSVETREYAWSATIDAIQDRPFGRGWGGLQAVLPPGLEYPHNVLLEIAGECGLLGLALFVGGVVTVTLRLVRASRRGNVPALATLSLFVFYLLNAMVSGDLNDNRGLFLLLGSVLGMTPWSDRRAVQPSSQSQAVP